MSHPTWQWVGFHILILFLLALDLGVHRDNHVVRFKEALGWSLFWIFLSCLFAGWVWWEFGRDAGIEFFTGWLVEKSLSVDNLFVFILIFSAFKVDPRFQHRILFWGILGALFMRGGLIAAGAWIIDRAGWVLPLFGLFLLVTGLRMFKEESEEDQDPRGNPVLRLARRIIPVTDHDGNGRFFVKEEYLGRVRWVATPLFLVLILVETTDLVFALDSVPAIFGITQDPFIVYTSNVFAILGLRALYFLLADVVQRLRFLRPGLATILVFVGLKMMTEHWVHMSPLVSLAIIISILAAAVVGSILFPGPEEAPESEGPEELEP